jgi:hypothetical protein
MIGRLLERWHPRPLPPQPPTAKDWGIGDVAKCIGSGAWLLHPTAQPVAGPSHNQVVRVKCVMALYGTVWLSFRGWDGFYAAGYFRKLRPCSADFRQQLSEPLKPIDVKTPELVP